MTRMQRAVAAMMANVDVATPLAPIKPSESLGIEWPGLQKGRRRNEAM